MVPVVAPFVAVVVAEEPGAVAELPVELGKESLKPVVPIFASALSAQLFVSSSGFQLRQRFFSHVARKGFRFGKGVPLSLFGFAS